MNFRGLFKVAAVCAIGYAAISLASYISALSANGFLIARSKLPNAEELYTMLQLRGNHISLRLDLFSYFLLIPALVGIYVYLRELRPGRAHIGGAFAAFALIVFFVQTALSSTAMTLAQGPMTESLKERLVSMNLLAFSLMMPALWSVNVANLLWGFALRTQVGLAKLTGNFFILQVCGLLIAVAGFSTDKDVLGNTGILINTVAMAASFVLAGVLLRKASKDEIQTPNDAHFQSRAAGASA